MTGAECHDCGTLTDARDADSDGRCPRCAERSNPTCPECLNVYTAHAKGCRVGASEMRVRALFAVSAAMRVRT